MFDFRIQSVFNSGTDLLKISVEGIGCSFLYSLGQYKELEAKNIQILQVIFNLTLLDGYWAYVRVAVCKSIVMVFIRSFAF